MVCWRKADVYIKQKHMNTDTAVRAIILRYEIDLAAMKAANAERDLLGLAQAYDEDAFYGLGNELDKELEEAIKAINKAR